MDKNQLERNFQEIESPLSHREAVEEANRCLYCYDAPCIQACPTHIDIPSFIKKITTGNVKGSAMTIMSANPIGASCSRVCPTEELCEGACVLNESTKPIQIGKLQRYATDWAMHNKQVLFQVEAKRKQKIAIVGSGPAGLSAARELARMGYGVTIFERDEQAGGLNTYGIVSFRLPQTVAQWEVEQVRSLGVHIRTNTCVGVDVTAEELQRDFDFVILAIGMGNVPHLQIEGEQLEGVCDAIQFVRETKAGALPLQYKGKRAVVIGAGNTAIDAATCSVRLGAENVKILYRRTKEEMTAYDFEYEFAKQDQVEFRWLTAPKRIIGNEQGKVVAIECVKMELKQQEQGGRKIPVPVANSEFIIETDVVIKAIGQARHISITEHFNIVHEDGVVTVNEQYQTSQPHIFACGDVIFGKGKGEAMVVTAAQQGKMTAYAIDHIMKSVAETV